MSYEDRVTERMNIIWDDPGAVRDCIEAVLHGDNVGMLLEFGRDMRKRDYFEASKVMLPYIMLEVRRQAAGEVEDE